MNLDWPQPIEGCARRGSGGNVKGLCARSRQDDVAFFQSDPKRIELSSQPGDRGRRIAEHGICATLGHFRPVQGKGRLKRPKIIEVDQANGVASENNAT